MGGGGGGGGGEVGCRGRSEGRCKGCERQGTWTALLSSPRDGPRAPTWFDFGLASIRSIRSIRPLFWKCAGCSSRDEDDRSSVRSARRPHLIYGGLLRIPSSQIGSQRQPKHNKAPSLSQNTHRRGSSQVPPESRRRQGGYGRNEKDMHVLFFRRSKNTGKNRKKKEERQKKSAYRLCRLLLNRRTCVAGRMYPPTQTDGSRTPTPDVSEDDLRRPSRPYECMPDPCTCSPVWNFNIYITRSKVSVPPACLPPQPVHHIFSSTHPRCHNVCH